MRALTPAAQAVYEATGGSYTVHLRAYLSNDNWATSHALRDLAGRDWLLGAAWEETIDQGVSEAKLTVMREQGNLSLAPDMTTSALNLLSGSYSPLLQKGKSRVRIQVAPTPVGAQPLEADYLTAWEGYVCGIADSGEGALELFCRDNSWPYLRTFIENERVYGLTAGQPVEYAMAAILLDNYDVAGVTRWTALTTFNDGDYVCPTGGHSTGLRYIGDALVGTSASTGATEPTWPTTLSGSPSVDDGGMRWYADSIHPVLYVPTSPAWDIGRYLQQRENVWTAIETLAMQIGWYVRQRWSSADSAFRLTLYSPDRAKTVPDYTLTTYQRRAVPSWGGDVDDIRNVVEVFFYDRADLDAAGQPKFKSVKVEDSASIALYDRVYMAYTPAAAANIDTTSEATTLANAALSDLSQPPVDVELDCAFLHHLELGDLVRVPPDNVHHDVDSDMSVTRVAHVVAADGAAKTTLSLRGQPMVARRQWLIRQGTRGVSPMVPELGPDAVTGLAAEPTTGGVAISFSPPLRAAPAEEYELHLSTSSSFTPSSSTFYAKGKQTTFNVTDLTPGTTYYAKVVTRKLGLNGQPGLRGDTSSEVSYTARYVEPRTLQPRITYAALPLNSDFEAYNDTSAPPDTWEMSTGAWGTDATADASFVGSGTRAVKFTNTAVASKIRSAVFLCREYDLVRVTSRLAVGTAFKAMKVWLRWLDKSFAEISLSEVGGLSLSSASTDYSDSLGETVEAPATTCYAQVLVGKNTAEAFEAWVDTVRVFMIGGMTTTTGGHALSYSNSFGDLSGHQALYNIDPFGFLWFQGAMTRASAPAAGTLIATLPAGHRPAERVYVPLATDSDTGGIYIETDGTMKYARGSVTEMWLSGVRFRVLNGG